MELTHLSLFSGIGGIDLAAEWAGFETVGQCEWADYPTKILEKHWPNVPRWRDIHDLTQEDFYERTGFATVDLVSGGFPCQPFSVAGKQRGKADDRHLWPEMLRVIGSIRPTWVLGENVPGILRIAGQDVCQSLADLGYSVTIFAYEAAAVGAPHRRERVFFVGHRNDIVGYAEHDGQLAESQLRSNETTGDYGWQKESQAARQSPRTDRSADASSIRRCECGSECHEVLGDTIGGRRSGQPRRRSGSVAENGHPRVEAEPGTVADADGRESNAGNVCQSRKTQQFESGTDGSSENGIMADADSERRQRSENTGEIERSGQVCEQLASGCYPVKTGGSTQSRLGGGIDGIPAILDGIRRSWLDGTWELGIPRVATGIKNRADRIKALGNAVVPQQVYPILKAMADIEKARKDT